MKRDRKAASEGVWWRSTQYEISQGWIRPTAKSKLERYNPWREFWESRNHTVGQAPFADQPPYQSLMKLVHGLEYKDGPRRYPACLTPQSLDSITNWCRDHGPLGVLLSRWEAITLAATPGDSEEIVQRRYVRGPGRLIQVIQSSGEMGDGRGSVVIHALHDMEPKVEPPQQTWCSFFPSVNFAQQDTFQYPLPYTDEFFRLYAERVYDFCKAAEFLTGAMVHLGPHPPAVPDGDLARQQAVEALNVLRRPVSSVLEFGEKGDLASSWVAPSLLADFAEMYVQDLMFGRPALTCACCGVAFVSSAYQAQYCSLNCRYRYQKRRLRQQIKEAHTLRAAGETVQQIAGSLGQKPKVVSGWLKKR